MAVEAQQEMLAAFTCSFVVIDQHACQPLYYDRVPRSGRSRTLGQDDPGATAHNVLLTLNATRLLRIDSRHEMPELATGRRLAHADFPEHVGAAGGMVQLAARQLLWCWHRCQAVSQTSQGKVKHGQKSAAIIRPVE
jgi:hypothetical protein